MPRATAAFNLDRLVDEGLLEVSFQRRTGRTGPGVGRTAKLYRRSDRHVDVSVPDRRYELAGRLLASAAAEAERTGQSPRAALNGSPTTSGENSLTRCKPGVLPTETTSDGVLHALEKYGFEPRVDNTDVVLANCPFHTLAQDHTNWYAG